MQSVIDLAAYRARRARNGVGAQPRPPDASEEDQIVVKYQPDGSYLVRISGVYAESRPLAVEVLADVIQRLAIEAKLAVEHG